MYRDPSPWFNVQLIQDSCPDVIFHCSETHQIHKIGGYLKNFGLRTCMILEATSASDACILKMLEDQIVATDHGNKCRPPSLQLILENPDFEELQKLSDPLEEYKQGDAKRRGNTKATMTLQKQIDRVMSTVEDLDVMLSPEYMEQAAIFVDNGYQEIERIRGIARSESRKATSARKTLQKRLLSKATFSKPQA